MASIYQEAIDKLRRGELNYSNNIILLGHKQLAQDIDKWVRTEFIKTMRIDHDRLTNPDPSDRIRYNVMVGFLYQRAVEKLRDGDFTVLNAESAAESIEQWVQKELLRRLGVQTGE